MAGLQPSPLQPAMSTMPSHALGNLGISSYALEASGKRERALPLRLGSP